MIMTDPDFALRSAVQCCAGDLCTNGATISRVGRILREGAAQEVQNKAPWTLMSCAYSPNIRYNR